MELQRATCGDTLNVKANEAERTVDVCAGRENLDQSQGISMRFERRIGELIENAWRVLETDCDAISFQDWKREASGCLTDLLGSDHTYTRYFNDCVRDAKTRSILAGGGILEAARAGLANGHQEIR